jgi:RNA polymerase sigma-70 factor (ECF subfamily)
MAGLNQQWREASSESESFPSGERRSGKKDALELKTDREASQRVDALLRQAINNDREALDELFTLYRGRLYNTLLRLLGNPDDAEEVLQDGLLAAFRNLSRFKGRSQFSTWLTRIVINAGLMRLRRSRPEVMTSIDQPQVGGDEQPCASRLPDPAPNPEERYARQEWLQIVEHRLRSLPAANRKALWLRDVVGLSTREAAEALAVPTGSLKSQLHRARLRLREEVAEARPVHILQSSRCVAAITRHRPDQELRDSTTCGLRAAADVPDHF